MEFSEPKGIYLQIADRVQERILQGDWVSGQQIPSVREMAVELGVNPNTVARSYQALVERRVLATRRGRGYFITEDAVTCILSRMRKKFLQEELPEIIRTMRLLGIGSEEFARYLEEHDNIPGGTFDET